MMKYNYHVEDNTLEIKDAMKMQIILVYLLMFMMLVTGSKKLFQTYKSQTDLAFLDIYWILLMLIACIILIYYFKKRSYLSKIPVEEIKFFREKSVLGTTQFYFELSNGKRRYLFNLKKDTDIEELQKAVLESGVKTLE